MGGFLRETDVVAGGEGEVVEGGEGVGRKLELPSEGGEDSEADRMGVEGEGLAEGSVGCDDFGVFSRRRDVLDVIFGDVEEFLGQKCQRCFPRVELVLC